MAQTIVPAGNAPNQLAVKIWSAKLMQFALGESFFVSRFADTNFVRTGKKSLIGTSPDMPIQLLRDLEKSEGDTIQYDVFADLKGDGVYGDAQLKGKEDKLTPYMDSVRITQVRKGVDAGGRLSRKRTKHDLRMVARTKLGRWFARFFDEVITCYLAGHRGESTAQWVLPTDWNGLKDGDTVIQPLEPADEEHTFYLDSTGGVGHDLSAAEATTLALKWFDKLDTYISVMDTPPNPVYDNGEPHYIVILHPIAAEQLRTETSTNSWLEIQKYAGPRGQQNPIFRDSLGKYGRFILHKFSKIPVVTVGDKKYAMNLVLGAQAAVIAFGDAGGKFSLTWHEEIDDRGNRLVVTASTIFGCKKVRFNGKDFGVIVMPTLIE